MFGCTSYVYVVIIPSKMVGNLQTIMFLLYTFVLSVDPIDAVIALVNVCPNNTHDVIQASKRLGCGNDTYGNNKYLCLPNENKTSLVEFCFQGVMGLVEEGNCLEFSEGKWIYHSCNHFLFGCPDENFLDHEIYRYPACQNIRTELQCYVMDRNCTAQSNTEELSGHSNVIFIMSIGSAIIVFIISCIILFYKRRRENINQRNKDENSADIEQRIPLSETESRKDNEIRMVLIGKTGSGKNATGNTILGIDYFESYASGSSVTSKLSQTSAIRFGHKFLIVDTPGIFDTTESNMNTKKEIHKCISISSPGPHAFILVLDIGRYTEEQNNAVRHFVDTFGEKIFRYFIILFTRKDDLDEEGKHLDDFIKTVPQTLQTLIEKCGRRVIAFNNRLKGDDRDEQVKELLSMVLKNVEKNHDECYKNEMYEEAENLLQKREAKIRRKTQMERDKKLKAIEKAIKKKYSKETKKHKRKTAEESKQWRKEHIKKQKEERKAKKNQLQMEYDEQVKKARDILREEALKEN